MTLSLRKWPEEPAAYSQYRVSPTSEKVIKDSGITIEDIIPMTFVQFQTLHKKQCLRTDMMQQYENYNVNRSKKIKLLKTLYEQQRKKSKSIHKNYFHLKKNSSDHSPKPTSQHKKAANISKKKGKNSRDHNSSQTYLNYYVQNNQTEKKKSRQPSQATKRKSQKCQTPKHVLNDEYYTDKSIGTFRFDRTIRNQREDDVIVNITEALNNWVKIDALQTKQRQDFDDLNEQQRKRLKKIHYIEREQLREKIIYLKSKLTHNILS